MGTGSTRSLDTRYERIGGGKGWSMVREIGAQARTGMIASGVRAYVSVRRRADGAWAYTVGRVSPFVPFNVPAILRELDAAEDPHRGTWGGGNLVGGSPRLRGSSLQPSDVARIVGHALDQSHTSFGASDNSGRLKRTCRIKSDGSYLKGRDLRHHV